MQGIIIENISNLYKIKAEDVIYDAMARGKFKQEEVTPLVGDIVEFEVIQSDKLDAVINKIMPRKTEIKRPKVANVTQMLFVVSTKNPKTDLLMLDKQLAYAEYMKITPIIIINKIDLSDIYKKITDIYTNVGYMVIETNAKDNVGIDKVANVLQNNISAFSGNSGVGKSTIINSLFGKNTTLEGEISEKNKKGKNTTTSVKLYELDKNSYIADTPGFASFEVNEIESNELENYFIDIKKYVYKCEYVGCTHLKEENCGVKDALKDGLIEKSRYENFCKIYNELKNRKKF